MAEMKVVVGSVEMRNKREEMRNKRIALLTEK